MDTKALAESARKGNDAAFSELMELHKVKLYKIAYSYLKNEPDSLEAIQEVTYRAYKTIGKLKNPDYVSTWLIRVMMNYCLDELKKRKRTLPQAADIPDNSSLQSENQSLEKLSIESAMNQIDPTYQTVINLKYYHDLTTSEIAQMLEKPEGTIKTWLSKALKTLRTQLEKDGEHHA